MANMMALIVLSDAAATCFDIDARAQKLEASLVVLWISDICLIMYILELILVTIARGFRTFKELSTLLDVFIISLLAVSQGDGNQGLNAVWRQRGIAKHEGKDGVG